ncbi:hypothetical protein PIB30_063941 [Stylosanthes scabra]|uniref:Leucine-rich repeat-containing N-terminal plant-type domain-containing protein n=1 Tax=Stylosanthes scabra TaxID=79078 RepID=A0ABU6RLM4_9FABA|nr:hypothetical protein [Stylosanthes scabra]
MAIEASLVDPHSILDNWDEDAVDDPCSWNMATCSPQNFVISLVLQNNNITGPIPSELGRLSMLQTLDLSNDFFDGEIPQSLGHLRTLHYLRLNNNSFSAECPVSVANTWLSFLFLNCPTII